jgi:hypothetical protein
MILNQLVAVNSNRREGLVLIVRKICTPRSGMEKAAQLIRWRGPFPLTSPEHEPRETQLFSHENVPNVAKFRFSKVYAVR